MLFRSETFHRRSHTALRLGVAGTNLLQVLTHTSWYHELVNRVSSSTDLKLHPLRSCQTIARVISDRFKFWCKNAIFQFWQHKIFAHNPNFTLSLNTKLEAWKTLSHKYYFITIVADNADCESWMVSFMCHYVLDNLEECCYLRVLSSECLLLKR